MNVVLDMSSWSVSETSWWRRYISMSERKSSLEREIQGHPHIDGNQTTRQNETTWGEYRTRRKSGYQSVGTPTLNGQEKEMSLQRKPRRNFQSSKFTILLWTWKQRPWVGFSLSISSAIHDWVGKSAYSRFKVRESIFVTCPNHVLQTNLVTNLIFWSPSAWIQFLSLFRTVKKEEKKEKQPLTFRSYSDIHSKAMYSIRHKPSQRIPASGKVTLRPW